MNNLTKVFTFLLYLTPLGPILSVGSVMKDNENNYIGVTLVFPKNSSEPLTVTRPTNPTTQMRLRWFVSGVSILVQTFFLIQLALNSSRNMGTIAAFAVLCGIIGLTQLVSALFPNLDLNKKL
jgi:hypothetical protein